MSELSDEGIDRDDLLDERDRLKARVTELESRLALLLGHESGWIAGIRDDAVAAERAAVVAWLRHNDRADCVRACADRVEAGEHLKGEEP